MNEPPDWSTAGRVLCVRLDDIGGVLMSTPAIRALRQALPRRRITLLASKAGARAAAGIPEVDEAIGYDAPWMTRAFPPGIAADLAMRYALAMRGFDAAVIFTAPGQSPLPASTMCRLAGVPLRLAHHGDQPGHPHTHEVRRQLDLVASVGARADDERLSLRVRPQAMSCARLKLEEAGVDTARPFLVVHPGAALPSRRWAAERFAACADQLTSVLDCQVVVTGDAAERELAESVRRGAGPRARSLAGSLSLAEFAAVIDLAALLLSNDSGAVHIAAALGTPVIDLYASATPRCTPWMVAHRVIPGDGGGRRLADVHVEEVVAAACDLWLDIHWRAAA